MKPTYLKPSSQLKAEQRTAPTDADALVWVFDSEAKGECCPGISDLGDGTFRVVDVNAVEPDAMPATPVRTYAEAFEAALACRSAYTERAAHDLHEHRNWVFGGTPKPLH